MKKILLIFLAVLTLVFTMTSGITAKEGGDDMISKEPNAESSEITYDFYEKIDISQLLKDNSDEKYLKTNAINKILGNGYLIETPVDKLITKTYDLDIVWDTETGRHSFLGGGPFFDTGYGTRSLAQANEDYAIECIRPIDENHLLTINKVMDNNGNISYCYTFYYFNENWVLYGYPCQNDLQLWMPSIQYLVSEPKEYADFAELKPGTPIYDVLEMFPESEISTVYSYTHIRYTKNQLLDLKNSEIKLIQQTFPTNETAAKFISDEPIINTDSKRILFSSTETERTVLYTEFKQYVLLTDGILMITYSSNDPKKDYCVSDISYSPDFEVPGIPNWEIYLIYGNVDCKPTTGAFYKVNPKDFLRN